VTFMVEPSGLGFGYNGVAYEGHERR